MVISGYHVLCAQIDERDDMHPEDLPNTVEVKNDNVADSTKWPLRGKRQIAANDHFASRQPFLLMFGFT